MSKTDSTYVTLSRGLEEHIPDMNAQACRIYIYLLIKATALGKDRGKYNISIGQLASDLKMHRVTMQKIISDHLKDKYISINPGKNQHQQTEFTILKYKTVNDFACSQNTTTKATSTEQPRLQAGNKQVTSTVENSNNNTGLQPPNKVISKEGKKTTNPNVKTFLDYCHDSFKNKYGSPLNINGGKDGAIVKRLLKKYKLEKLKLYWDYFLDMDNKFINEAGKDIGIFNLKLNLIITQKNKQKNPKRLELAI